MKTAISPRRPHTCFRLAVGQVCTGDLLRPALSELFRKYALSDVEMIVLCAEWPIGWSTANVAAPRAIENQCFSSRVNAWGQAETRTFSAFHRREPWGEHVWKRVRQKCY